MNRSMDRNHGTSDGDGQDSALSRMRVSLRQEQRVWIEKEAARRGVANNVIMRELVENALSGQTAVPPEPSSVPPVSRSSSRVPGADVLEAVLVDSPLARSDGVDSGCGAGGGAFVEAEPVAEALPTGVPPVPEIEASPSVGSPSVARSNGRAYSDPRLAQVVGDRRSAGARSPRVVSEGPVAPRVPSAVGRSTVLPGVGRGTRLPPGVGRSRVPAVAVSGVPMDGIGQPLPGDPLESILPSGSLLIGQGGGLTVAVDRARGRHAPSGSEGLAKWWGVLFMLPLPGPGCSSAGRVPLCRTAFAGDRRGSRPGSPALAAAG